MQPSGASKSDGPSYGLWRRNLVNVRYYDIVIAFRNFWKPAHNCIALPVFPYPGQLFGGCIIKIWEVIDNDMNNSIDESGKAFSVVSEI